MNRALRKRLQRLLQVGPPAVRPDQPVDQLTAQAHARCLAVLEPLTGDNAPEVAVALAREMLSLAQEVHDDFPRRLRLDCHQGCSWCCHEPLQVHILDAISVAHYRREQGLAPLDYQLPTRQRQELKSLFKPCPLLGAEGKCSVYAARPLICRAYHSCEVASCRRVVEQKDAGRQIPMDLVLFGMTGIPQAAVLKILEQLGLDCRPVVLGLAVAALERDFDAMTRNWLSGGDAFEAVAVLQ